MHSSSLPVLYSIHKPANCFQFFFSSTSLLFHLCLCNFTRICFGFLEKTLWFFPMVFDGKRQLLLFLSRPRSKGYFLLRQMTLRLTLVCSFTNFVIPLPATYIRHSQEDYIRHSQTWMPLTLILSKVIFLTIWLVWFAHQGPTSNLKRVYVSAYMLKNVFVRHIQGKNYKKVLKNTGAIRVNKNKNKYEKPFWFKGFFITLVI